MGETRKKNGQYNVEQDFYQLNKFRHFCPVVIQSEDASFLGENFRRS